MNYAKIENGKVTNVVLADAEFAAENGLIPLAPGAGIGWTYQNGIFTPPQPFPSWVLDASTNSWQPPTPYPTDGKVYTWDEKTLAWVPVVE